MSGKLSHLVRAILSLVRICCLAHSGIKLRQNKSHVCQSFKKLTLCSRLPMKNIQGEDTTMERKQDTEYKDILYKSFKPAYLFSKVLGAMPLSYKIKRTFNNREADKRSARATEFVWSWQSATYSGLWVVLQFVLKYWIFRSRRHHPPPQFKANSHNGDLSSRNFSEGGNLHHLLPPPTGIELWIGSVSHSLDFACTILALVIVIWGTRNIPEIFRQLQHLDDNADEDGYMLLDRAERRRLCRRGRIFCVIGVIVCCINILVSAIDSACFGIRNGVPLDIVVSITFVEVVRVGSVAGETQFIIICFFLRQRFAALNDMLVQLKTVRTKPLLDQWLYQSSRTKGAMTRGTLALQVSEAQSSITHHRLAGVTAADTRVISVPEDTIADTLGRLCRWHRQLCDLVDMVAACYGLLLFVIITYCFSSCVFGIYASITDFQRPAHILRLRPFIGCVICGCRLILISVIPSMTVAQAKMSRILVERLNSRYLDHASKEEISIFISHLSSRNIAFSVCGFFTLNIEFLRSIAVAIVTYVILLIQFKPSEN